MSLSTKHTERIWRNWPLGVEVTRGITVNDALTEITERRLLDIAVLRGDEVVIRADRQAILELRDALTKALDKTADLGIPTERVDVS